MYKAFSCIVQGRILYIQRPRYTVTKTMQDHVQVVYVVFVHKVNVKELKMSSKTAVNDVLVFILH